MSKFVFANNVNTELAATLTSSGTTVTLASSVGLPTLASGEMFPLTLNDAATGSFYEVVYVTAISGVTLTVLRGQEGTSALNWSIGDYAYSTLTAGSAASFANINGSASQVFNVSPGVSANEAVNLGQFASTLAASGYQKFPSGLIVQWGTATVPGTSATTVVFPIAFPTAFLSANATSDGAGGQFVFISSATPPTDTQMVLDNSLGSVSNVALWMAIGF